VSSNSSDYRPRSPADAALYQVVRDHFETFLARAASLRDGEGLTRFVERAFRDFLRPAGGWAGGFARFRCAACRLDRLVAFSCKGRALCPSCGGAAWPSALRIWLIACSLTCPCGMGTEPATSVAVCAGVGPRPVPRGGRRPGACLCRLLRDPAADAGVEGGRGGRVIVIQRFGGALN
jgi:hypothetical protein